MKERNKKIITTVGIILGVIILLLTILDAYNRNITEKAKVQSVENMNVNVSELLAELQSIEDTVSTNHITIGNVIDPDLLEDYSVMSDMDNILSEIGLLKSDILNFSDRLTNGGSLTDEDYEQIMTDYDDIVSRMEHINNEINEIVKKINNTASELLISEGENYDSITSTLDNAGKALVLSYTNLNNTLTSLSTTKLDTLIKYIKEKDDSLISALDEFADNQKDNLDKMANKIMDSYSIHISDTELALSENTAELNNNFTDSNQSMSDNMIANINAMEINEKGFDILGYINLYNNQYNNFLLTQDLLMRYDKANLVANMDAYYQIHGYDGVFATDLTFAEVAAGIENIPMDTMVDVNVQRHYHLTGDNVHTGTDDYIISNTPVGGCYVDLGPWDGNWTDPNTGTTYSYKPAENASPQTFSATFTDIDGNEVTYSFTQATFHWVDYAGIHGNGSIYGVGSTNGTHWAGAYPCGTHWGPITSSNPGPCPVHGDLCNGPAGIPAVCVSAWATYSGCAICDANGWTMKSDTSSGVVGKAIFDPNQGKSAYSCDHYYEAHKWELQYAAPAHIYAPTGCNCTEGQELQATVTYTVDSTDATDFLSN